MQEDPIFRSLAESNMCQEITAGGCSDPNMEDFMHWPFVACLLVVIIYVFLAIKFVRQYEGPGRPRGSKHYPYMGLFTIADLDGAELWKSCWSALHPRWLFGFRLFSFCYFLPQILYNFHSEGFWMFYFFTEWTFILLTAYFGVAAWVSAKYCFQLTDGNSEISSNILEEQVKLTVGDTTSGEVTDITVDTSKSSRFRDEFSSPGLVGYVMQILFQVAGAAVMMTDFVFWLILVPYLLPEDFKHTFIDINMHAVNAVFLVTEISLNNMYYPWFRTSYVVFWTTGYVVFQWILHAIGFKTWPYPFLDLATPWAPAWYAGLSLFHVVLAMLVMVIVNIKQHIVSNGRIGGERQVPSDSVPNL